MSEVKTIQHINGYIQAARIEIESGTFDGDYDQLLMMEILVDANTKHQAQLAEHEKAMVEEATANLLSYLVDHHENEPLSENTLQCIGVRFLANRKYSNPIHLPEAKPSHAGSCEHAFHKGNPCTCQPELPEAMRPILQDLVDSDVYQEVKKEIESPEPAVEVCEWKVDVDNGGFTTDCGYRHTKMHFTPTCPYCKLEIKEEG